MKGEEDGPFSTHREAYMFKPRQHIIIRGTGGGPRLKPQVALWTSALSRFSSHFARPNGYMDSGFLVRIRAALETGDGLSRTVEACSERNSNLPKQYPHSIPAVGNPNNPQADTQLSHAFQAYHTYLSVKHLSHTHGDRSPPKRGA